MYDQPVELVTTRANALIDPRLDIWQWEIPVYLFLGGLVAGILILGAVLELRRGDRPRSAALGWTPFLALVLLSLGMAALGLDLEHKLHIYRFFLAFRAGSPMSWGSWILLLVYPLGLGLGLLALAAEQRERIAGHRWAAKLRLAGLFRRLCGWADGLRRPILYGTIGVGIALGIYTGLLLGTLVARPQWHSAILGPLFLTSGLSTGAAFLLLFRLEPHEHEAVARWDVAAISAELVLLGLLLLGYATGGRVGQHQLYHVMGGPWTSAFWSLVVIAGLLVPLVMELWGLRRRVHVAVAASVLVLVGGYALRAILLGAGQASSFREFL